MKEDTGRGSGKGGTPKATQHVPEPGPQPGCQDPIASSPYTMPWLLVYVTPPSQALQTPRGHVTVGLHVPHHSYPFYILKFICTV